MEQVAFEMQAGFRPERGATGGLTGSKKRQEHGLESYSVHVDLVEAFTTVDQKALWEMLRKSACLTTS